MGPNPPSSESASTTHGHHSGKLYRKQRNLVTNLFDVDAEPHVEDDATASKLIWHAWFVQLWRQLPTAINIYNGVSND